MERTTATEVAAVIEDVGGGRQKPGNVGLDTPDGEVAAPAAVAHLDVRIGDKIRYKGTYGPRTGEVIEDRGRILLVRRFTEAFTWGSRSGGVRPILRERVIEVLPR